MKQEIKLEWPYGVLFFVVSRQSSGGGEAPTNVTEKKITFASGLQ